MKRVCVFVLIGVGLGLLSACGGSSASSASSGTSIVSCLRELDGGSKVISEEKPAEIGGLPAHVVIAFDVDNKDREAGTAQIYIFKNQDQAEDGVKVLEEESEVTYGQKVNTYADGTVAGFVFQSKEPKPTEEVLAECAE